MVYGIILLSSKVERLLAVENMYERDSILNY